MEVAETTLTAIFLNSTDYFRKAIGNNNCNTYRLIFFSECIAL